ncbi:transposase [Desulfococcaceae bacterium HSG9]|nr:transposase [Desulfococcaceae bacterium HSG9]
MPALVENIFLDFGHLCGVTESACRLIDAMPVIMANAKSGSRAKVAAEEIAEKGYCGSKGIWYYGVKLHVLGAERKGKPPQPEYIGVSGAGAHDPPVFRQIAPFLHGKAVYADKAYADALLKQQLIEEQDTDQMTPVKLKKGQKKLSLPEQLFSTAVSRVRQPIESLFSWLQEKTGIEIASKVRSYNGLMVHIFGKLAAAMLMLIFKS